jgi:hypothetical protein
VANNQDERRAVEEARRGDYLVGGHTPETQLALLTRDIEHLIDRVREGEDRIRELEKAKPSPEIVEMLEAYRRQQWITKRVGMFLLAGPAMVAIWQAATRLVEWIRGGGQ